MHPCKFKFVASQANSIHTFKNLREKVQRCCANIYFVNTNGIPYVCALLCTFMILCDGPDDDRLIGRNMLYMWYFYGNKRILLCWLTIFYIYQFFWLLCANIVTSPGLGDISQSRLEAIHLQTEWAKNYGLSSNVSYNRPLLHPFHPIPLISNFYRRHSRRYVVSETLLIELYVSIVII